MLIHLKIFFYPFQKVQIIWPARETGPNSKPYYLSSCGHDTLKLHKPYSKKSKRKVQGVPQSQTAALPRPQEEEETYKSKQAQTEQTYEKH